MIRCVDSVARFAACLSVVLVGCDRRHDDGWRDEPPAQEWGLPRLTAECGFAGHELPAEISAGLIGHVACNTGDDCPVYEHWMSGLRADLELDLSGAKATEFYVESEDESLVWVNGAPVVERDRCTKEPRIRQQLVLLAAGEGRVEVDVAQGESWPAPGVLSFQIRDPATTVLFATDDPDEEPIGGASAGDDSASEIELSVGDAAALSMRVLDEDGNPLTTLGSELWWVDDPALLRLDAAARVEDEPSDSDAAVAEPPAALPIRGTDIVLTSLREGSTVLHMLAGNRERTLTVRVTEP